MRINITGRQESFLNVIKTLKTFVIKTLRPSPNKEKFIYVLVVKRKHLSLFF